MTLDLRQRMDFAVSVSSQAGEIALRWFRNPDLAVETKSDASPVTLADREIESYLVARIRDAFPEDGILGEEHGEAPSRSGSRWIIDPIDGTRSFARGVPLFGTMLALETDGAYLVGVIHMPACGETVYAAKGLGAWWRIEDRAVVPARVSGVRSLDEAHLLCTSPKGFAKHGAEAAFRELLSRAEATRTWGDCYAYALVATGRAEIVVDPAMAIWDAAALIPILQEAGGAYTDWQGRARPDSGNGVGTNGWLHEEVLKILARA